MRVLYHIKATANNSLQQSLIFTVDAAEITWNRRCGRGQLIELRDWVNEVSIIASRALGISALLYYCHILTS